MKIHSLGKMRWWVVLLASLIICSGCAHKTQKPETAPPESREPAPSQPRTPEKAAPKEPTTKKTPSQTAPSASTAPAGDTRKESYYTHTVKWSGETISIIAAWYTGDLDNWKALAEVMTQNNPNANINRIYVGNKILIPESLLKTRDPMTKEFVDSFYSKSKTEKTPPKRPQTEEEEPKLFGPKELPK